MSHKKSQTNDWRLGVATFCIVLCIFIPIIWITRPQPYIHPHFLAAPYRAPAGCAVRTYSDGEPISLACADPGYQFDAWAKYGLRWPGRPGLQDGRQTGTYYRVGDDLIGIQCAVDDCIVNGVERNVYRVAPL